MTKPWRAPARRPSMQNESGCDGRFRTAAGVILVVLMVALKVGGGSAPVPEVATAVAAEPMELRAPVAHDVAATATESTASAARD